MLKYFSQSDFDNCDPSCSIDDVNKELLKKLDIARLIAKVPFVINSAYRSMEHEKAQGRTGTSSHTKGLAVDIKSTDSLTRFKIISSLLSVGLNRIGIGKNFIHVDMDTNKSSNVIWHYYD